MLSKLPSVKVYGLSSLIYCDYLVRCKTIGGDKPNADCVFPFRWNGGHYNSCVLKKYGPWCSTKVDETGSHIDGNWGTCPSWCPLVTLPDYNESVEIDMTGNLVGKYPHFKISHSTNIAI